MYLLRKLTLILGYIKSYYTYLMNNYMALSKKIAKIYITSFSFFLEKSFKAKNIYTIVLFWYLLSFT